MVDSSAGHRRALLDRIQIVKGWTKSGQSFEKVFDVAWANDREPDKFTGVVPTIGSTVDIEKATYTNTIGAVELKTVWTDPEFDPSLHAFYYARVLEIPTPRWTTIHAAKLSIAPPDVVPATQQERAWTSPIWYTPTAEARKLAKAGPTVEELKKQGAVALGEAELKALLVGKSPTLQNNVTGVKFRMIFSASGTANATQTLTPIDPGYVTSKFGPNQGQRRFNYAGSGQLQPSEAGDPAASSYLGTTSPYYVNNGKLVTDTFGTPFEITVYKMGDKYYGARSNEFGYVNYEIIPALKELNPLTQIFREVLGEPSPWIWDTSTWQGQALRGFAWPGQDEIFAVAISPDGQFITATYGDNSARVWNAQSRKAWAELRGHRHWVSAAAFDPFDSRILTTSGETTVIVWDLGAKPNNSRELLTLRGGLRAELLSVAFNPTIRDQVLTASSDGAAQL